MYCFYHLPHPDWRLVIDMGPDKQRLVLIILLTRQVALPNIDGESS